MNRRRFLVAGVSGVASAVAGCAAPAERPEASTRRHTTARPATSPAERSRPADEASPGNATALARRGNPSTICETAINPEFTIREVVDPAFARGWTGAEVPSGYGRGEGVRRRGLGSGASVIGVSRDGSHRAYPLPVVAEHEAVNDDFGGPILVTYCPLCRSPMVAERLVNGTPTTFHVSGNLWRIDGSDDNLVLFDAATRSYWSQILATALCGPKAGTELALLPTTLTTWGEWLDAHPETEVLLPPPASKLGSR